jgi:hypothetical protein
MHLKLTKKLVCLLFISGSIYNASAQVSQKIGTSPFNKNSSAVLELESTTKGFLPPRMTTAQRDAIVSPAKGLVLYNTDTDLLEMNAGTNGAPVWTVATVAMVAPLWTVGNYVANALVKHTDGQVYRANSNMTSGVTSFNIGTAANEWTVVASNAIAPDWVASQYYAANQLVVYPVSGLLYRANTAIPATVSTFDIGTGSNKWTLVGDGAIAPNWVLGTAYAKNQLVTHTDGYVYKANDVMTGAEASFITGTTGTTWAPVNKPTAPLWIAAYYPVNALVTNPTDGLVYKANTAMNSTITSFVVGGAANQWTLVSGGEHKVLSLGNFGTAANVNITSYTHIKFSQTTAGVTATLFAPNDNTLEKSIVVENTGTATLTLLSKTAGRTMLLEPKSQMRLVWNPVSLEWIYSSGALPIAYGWSARDYKVGELVFYGGELFRANSDMTSSITSFVEGSATNQWARVIPQNFTTDRIITSNSASSNLFAGIVYANKGLTVDGGNLYVDGTITSTGYISSSAGIYGTLGTFSSGISAKGLSNSGTTVLTYENDYSNGHIAGFYNTSTTAPNGIYARIGSNVTTAGSTTKFFSCYSAANNYVGGIRFANGSNSSVTLDTSSDRRLKDNIREFTGGLDIINKLALKRYNWKSSNTEGVGVIAQEANLVYPAAVSKGDDHDPPGENSSDEERGKWKPWTVAYAEFITPMMSAIQELSAEVTKLKLEIEALKK